jgi:DNA-binding LacI/PurR family transcriptional regulator
MDHMATITDVCRLAGVSKATVSRVLNHTGQVKESTREQVYKAIQELNYRPNGLAQALATQRSNTIGLVVSVFNGNFFGDLLRQAAQSVEMAGKHLIVTDGHDNPEREIQAIQMLVDRCCDGIILYSRFNTEEKIMELIGELPVPLMVMNRHLQKAPERTILFEQREAAHMAVTHLLHAGHRKIACITAIMRTPTAQARLQGYRDALADFGIEYDPDLVALGQNLIPSGYTACRELLDNGADFTALFCCTDNMAEGAYRALNESGRKIPGDVSVVGFDNEPMTAYMTPSLTTVHIPVVEMTKTAVDQVIRMINGENVFAIPTFHGELIVRESVAAPQL